MRSFSPSTGPISVLTGGLERWLYRLVRKHGGQQIDGWSFDFVHLHAKSGSLSPLKHFAHRSARHRSPAGAAGLSARHRARALGAERLLFTSKPIAVSAAAALPGATANPHLWITLWISCESSRAFRDASHRAIRDPILVLSGTKIGLKPLVCQRLAAPLTYLT